MRPFSLISAALLMACALPATSRAETQTASGAAVMQPPAVAACDEPGPRPQRVGRRDRHPRVYAHRRYRRCWAPLVVHHYPVWPAYCDAPIPAPWDPAYDRGMVLHFRSPPVSGVYIAEPGYPPTPPIRPFQPYRYVANGAVYQYDGITGDYIPLARRDAARVMAMLPAGPPPVP